MKWRIIRASRNQAHKKNNKVKHAVFLRLEIRCVALPRGAMGLSAVCDCGIS